MRVPAADTATLAGGEAQAGTETRLGRACANPLTLCFEELILETVFREADDTPLAAVTSHTLQNGCPLSSNSQHHKPETCFWGIAFINIPLKTLI